MIDEKEMAAYAFIASIVISQVVIVTVVYQIAKMVIYFN